MTKRIFFFAFAFLGSSIFYGCDTLSTQKAQPLSLTEAQKKVASAADQFGFDFFQQVHQNETDKAKNIFVSPLSVSMAFGLAMNGANGETRAEMEKALKLNGYSAQQINEAYQLLLKELPQLDPKVTFSIANSIWYRNGFNVKSSFLNTNQQYFDAEVKSLDFANPSAKTTINNWVSTHTKGKIPSIIDQIQSDVVMFLINALYFKGTWKSQFETKNTQDAPFTLANNTKVTAKMMMQNGEFAYTENDIAQIAELPYGNDIYSMSVILPKAGKTVEQVMTQLNAANWQTWTKALNKQKIDLYLPRFKTEYSQTLNQVMQNLGMKLAFTDAADLTGIADQRLMISEVKHKTFVEVNEEGTEAAAATSIGIVVTSLPSYPVMRVDRPFLFVIREKATGTLLFTGKIMNPNT